ncbi:hypothetical protein FPRO05_12447 [Fusarium proliferatum]|uniref:C2H2-type domain-containing protein n=1 Tax=Gibberella intermedia TaxID=948311 RepID=A0A365N3I0_GIBIN|nr:hypothetical protein FPRO05_12447 [Fusarium proliferatum]
MASTSSPLEPDDEEPKVLPTGQLYPTPFDLTGDVTKCSRHEVTDCNPLGSELQDLIPYLKSKSLKEKYSSSSSPRMAQSSSSFSPLAPPRIRVPLRRRSTRELSVFCPDCGRGFSRTFNMRRHQQKKDCKAQSEKEKEHSMPEATGMDDPARDSDQDIHVSSVDHLSHDDPGENSLNDIPIMTQSPEGQHIPQDAIHTLEAIAKTENTDETHQYLNTLTSPKSGQSHDTSEELDDRDSSQTPRSDKSSPITETYIDNRKRRIIDSVVFAMMQWLRSYLDVWRKNAGGNSNSASGISEAVLSSHLRTGSSNPKHRGDKKRKAAQLDDQGTDNENEGGNKEDPQSSSMSIQAREDPKYACPYFKYNPAKEHLYRRHKQPRYRCARCWQPFTDEQGLMDHQRTNEPCPLREMEYVEGFDAAQERSLKSRKRAGQTLSEAEKWRRVFKILFPHVLDDDIPSPFYDYSQTSQQDACRHLESGSLAQCEQYMLREVPQRLRQALGRELDRDLTIVEDNLRRRAGDYVRTLIEEVFQELRQIRCLSSPAPRLEANNDIPAPAEGPQLIMSELPSGEGANPYFEGQGEAWPINFDLDFFAPSSILEELQFPFNNGGLIEDLLRPGDDGTGEATKQSDSGYVSNSPG